MAEEPQTYGKKNGVITIEAQFIIIYNILYIMSAFFSHNYL